MSRTLGTDMDVKVKPEAPLLIGELAAATGASPRSLRHYEAQGLIASTRQGNGYRTFDPEVVGQVRRIRRLLDAGFTLASIGVLLPCLEDDAPIGMCPAVAEQVRRAVGELDEQAADLARRRRAIERLVGAG
ncbi:MerR family transcriptional regulator [Janibacter alkaliphilus]